MNQTPTSLVNSGGSRT